MLECKPARLTCASTHKYDSAVSPQQCSHAGREGFSVVLDLP